MVCSEYGLADMVRMDEQNGIWLGWLSRMDYGQDGWVEWTMVRMVGQNGLCLGWLSRMVYGQDSWVEWTMNRVVEQNGMWF